ncbi:MAG: cytochrome c oxidase subunit II [Nocardioides sp.]|nr:cytochrome c oxidase subunit II [Nocardioides sp.]
MGLQLPELVASTRRRARRLALLTVLGLSVLLVSGCSADSQGQLKRLAMPEPASAQGDATLRLWQGAWIAALATGFVVWGLIAYVVVRFRRRNDNEIPVQTRYNLPLEIFYTIAPVIMVIAFFAQTVKTQNTVLEQSPTPDHVVKVVGQKWSWTFNYTGEQAVDERNVYVSGTSAVIPKLVLPVGESVRFDLYSPDVIHDFGVPAFLLKMDVIPGRVNNYEITPTATGTYRGACYELCGTFHSRMLFTVDVVTPQEYDAYLQGLLETGVNDSDAPILGGNDAYTPAGGGLDTIDMLGIDEGDEQ